MLGNVFIEETFRLQENVLLSSNIDANEQAHQTFRKKKNFDQTSDQTMTFYF